MIEASLVSSVIPAALGEVEFAYGGQPTSTPQKYLVSMEDAVAAACHYLLTGELPDPQRRWLEGETNNRQA